MVYPQVQYHGPTYPDHLQPETRAISRELDSRTSDGIQVRLLWHPDDGRVSVAVDDTKTGEVFDLLVGDRESALEAFHHPFADADRRHRAAESGATSDNRAIAA